MKVLADLERYKEYLDESLVHKIFVLQSVRLMSAYLIDNSYLDMAIALINRCSVHDNSKFQEEEMESLMSIEDKSDFKDPNILLTEEKSNAIKLHWKNNSHHPEHFDSIYDMSDLDLMEMACDCYARSKQYETDFLDFISTRQINRFKFPTEIYEKFYCYCSILDELGKNNEQDYKVIKKTSKV